MEKNNKQTGKRSYGSQFLRRQTMKGRGNKSIYVREEYHDKLSLIVQIIGGGKIPLYAYLDNILKQHFEQFREDIVKDYEKMNKPLI
ncbi:DUF3408 domain-containing protein [Chryseobacterium gambrini]|jgi:hypothetical protein|uniref:DUF3408 domain-containing protein n=1 Tax=Chryseobacterium gambrini TaxID=373672 RepID=UPI0025B29200|nr:DUF3408 domain-containing protein [Chryseobacterium gambrini]MDN4028911.1 DUF3408 domain-containing protein [Chryseobacterium gambrini]